MRCTAGSGVSGVWCLVCGPLGTYSGSVPEAAAQSDRPTVCSCQPTSTNHSLMMLIVNSLQRQWGRAAAAAGLACRVHNTQSWGSVHATAWAPRGLLPPPPKTPHLLCPQHASMHAPPPPALCSGPLTHFVSSMFCNVSFLPPPRDGLRQMPSATTKGWWPRTLK